MTWARTGRRGSGPLVVEGGVGHGRTDAGSDDPAALGQLDVDRGPQAPGVRSGQPQGLRPHLLPRRYLSRATPPTGLRIMTWTAPTSKWWVMRTRATGGSAT
jgi:hypothetical protein